MQEFHNLESVIKGYANRVPPFDLNDLFPLRVIIASQCPRNERTLRVIYLPCNPTSSICITSERSWIEMQNLGPPGSY